MRLATISIIVITFIIYMGKIENGKVLAIPIATIEPTTVDTAIKAGVELSKKILNTLKDAIESSRLMKTLARDIKKIKLVDKLLTENEIKLVDDAKLKLALAEENFSILRIELTGMAELTKATTKKLIKFTNRSSDDSSPTFNRQFEVIFKKFINLMTVTSIKLKVAKDRYEKMSNQLAETKVTLTNFKERVEALDDKTTKRHEEYENTVRSAVYGTFGVLCDIAGTFIYWVPDLISGNTQGTKPLTCTYIVDPIVENAVESSLAEYQVSLDALKEKMKIVYGSVTGILKKITAKDKELKKELTLLTNWENLVLVAKEDYGKKNLTDTIQDILVFKDLAIEDFQELYNAADAFNKWILKRN